MTAKKSVLLYMAKIDVGGIENLFLNLIPQLDDQFSFHIAYYGDGANELGEQFEAMGCTIERVEANRFRHPIKFIRELRRCIRNHGVDVLHANAGYSTFFALIASYLEHVPVRIAHSHSSKFGVQGNPLNAVFRPMCKIACHFLATDRINIGSKSASSIFFHNDSSVFVPNGIDLNRFSYHEGTRAILRRKLGASDDTFVVLHVGRFVPVKNHEFLLTVFSEILQVVPNALLVLVGDGPLKSEIRQKSLDLGIFNKVRFAGIVRNTEDYYSAADAFVFPSIYEGLSLSLVEAQANGLSCFTSDAVDSDTKVTDNLFFLPLKDEAAWAKEILLQKRPRMHSGLTPELQRFDCRYSAKIIGSLYLGHAENDCL